MKKKGIPTSGRSLLATLFLLLFLCSDLLAQDFEVQPQLQAALYKKIVSMTLASKDVKPRLLIMQDDEFKNDIDAISQSFEKLGLKLLYTSQNDIVDNWEEIKAVFLSKPNKTILSECEKRGILTLTGYRSMVEKGAAAIAIINESGKPKIMINKKRFESEKQEELFNRLAKVSIIVE